MSRAVDPTGRLDIFAVNFVDRLAELYLPLPLRLVYHRCKPEIHRSIGRRVGRVKLSADELTAIREAVFNAAAARRQVRAGQGDNA